MNRFTNTVLLGILAVGGGVATVGCTTTTYTRADDATDLTVTASSTKVLVNETVTFFPRTENTLGRNAKLTWTSTGGKLTTKDPGPIAQVTFDKPGTYSVDGVLSVDGKEVKRATTVITVSPLQPQ